MRGGALPLLCWAALLTVTGTLNAIWTGDWIQTATFAAAVLAVAITAAVLIVRAPEAAHHGEPARQKGPEAIPTVSFAAAFTAVGLGMLVFGLVFGHFPIYFGAGMIVVGLGRLVLELRAQRRALSAESNRTQAAVEK